MKKIILLLLIAVLLLSCSEEPAFTSPFDLDNNPNLLVPANLIIVPQSSNSLKLTWEDTNKYEQGYKISRKVGNGEWQNNIATVGVNINTWTDTNAPIGNTYTYSVCAYSGSFQSNTAEITEEFVLSAPIELTITPQSATSIKLNWTDTNQFEQGYKISRKVGDGEWKEDIASAEANSTSWIDTSAPYGTTYTYRVKAYVGSHYSNAVEETEEFELSAPADLNIIPQSATSLKLTWTDTNQFEEGYKISRKVGNGEWQTNIAVVDADSPIWIDMSAPYGTTYTYRVRAYAGGNYSSSVDKTEEFVLSAPGNLVLTPLSATSIKLNWTDTNQFEEGYKISRKVGNGEWQANIATVGANKTTWIDDDAPIGNTYTYRVRAYAGGNYSSSANETEEFVLSAPADLTISPESATSLKITWTDTNEFEEGYKISRKVGDGAWEDGIATLDANIVTWTDSNAPIGNTYTYRVKAFVGEYYSNAAEQTEAFILSAPSNLTIIPQSSASLKLTWIDTNEFEEGYKISRKAGSGAWDNDIATVGPDIASWTDTDAPYGTTYIYRVRAYAGESYSNAAEESKEFLLSAPTNLAIIPQSATSLKLTWNDTNQLEEGYKISRKVGDGEWQEDIASVDANVSMWIDTNAPYGTTYTYRVKAFLYDNYSSAAEKMEALFLTVPGNLILTPLSAMSIKLNWTDTNQFEEGYKISRKVGDGEWEEDIASVGANLTVWTDTDAPIGNIYTYRVRAYAGENYSNAVEQTDVFLLSPPTNLTITPQSATSLKLTWSDTNQFEQGFKISRKVGNGAWQENIATVGVNVTNWVDSSINNNAQYQYRIRAYYQSHYSDYSNTTILDLTKLVYVQGGTFQMGSNGYSADERPIHSVTLSSFLIGKYELTQSEWQTVMTGNNNGISANPSSFSGNPNRPVEQVSWYAVIVFCNRKSIQEGLTPCYAKSGNTNPGNWGTMPTSSTDTQWNAITCNWSANGYRLPTEAEWEYAARGGNQSNGYIYSGSNSVSSVAWYDGNSSSRTHDVGTKAANELGIYDMSGNVFEWCWDWYNSSYYSSSPSSNPKGPSSGSYRVSRGGSWNNYDVGCRVAYRYYDSPGDSNLFLGLRLVRTLE